MKKLCLLILTLLLGACDMAGDDGRAILIIMEPRDGVEDRIRRRAMKWMRCSLFILLLLFAVGNTYAYVITFYRYEPAIYEVSHRSMVIYDRDNQKIGLIPQIAFRGRAEDFCVVVPTPAAPRIYTVARNIFYEADQLTASIYRDRGSGCFSGGDILVETYDGDMAMSDSVDVINEQSAGVFNTVTLSADDPTALVNWLQDNGYNYTANDKDILDYYIQRGWVFTAMKLNDSVENENLDYYNVNPVLFRYSADSLIYPLRLSSINAGDRTNVVTYILSDSKMTFPGARVEYANNIDDKELDEILERYPAFGGLIGQSRYLTKLKRTFSIMEMDADVEIVPASDDEEFRQVIYYSILPVTDFIPLGIVAIFFLAFRALNERRKRALRETNG